ncbi:hypothetical protein PIB30_096073 [Stylosanthes scabra]|uniref:Uncharacterized protein n=1 Tax=Stylosanthes scabra TaxID=79078 RepID=A0ABU6UYL3_9FABA|nr:hypothetical protein [Stylosanthes scabra]
MASSSSVSVFDNYRFKTAFNKELYNTIVKNKKVIAEVCFDLMDDEYPEICEQIALRGWRRLAAPKPEISIDLIHEFYANAIITEEEMEDTLTRALSEIPVIRAILIYCIMNGEDVHAEDIIADKMVRMAQGIKEKGKLGFPSTIYKLCKEADEDQPMPQAEEGNEEGQPEFDHQPEYDHQQDFQHEPQFQQPPLYEVPIYTDQHEKDLHSIETQLQNMMWYQQQCLENINKSQAEYLAELRAIKGKQQEMYDNNGRFYNQVREEQREMAKEIQQVKNYQVNQTLVESARNKVLMDELAAVRSKQEEFFSNHANQYNMIRQEQKLLGKEILDVKKYQMSTVIMGSSSSPQKYEPDQALMKIREQHANFSEMQRQLKEWTRISSARECYSVWAHQQANPNLVEMPVHKITKHIYDNNDNNRPLFYGLLKSDLQPSKTAPPPPQSKDPHNTPK